jgi:hypothetical protein
MSKSKNAGKKLIRNKIVRGRPIKIQGTYKESKMQGQG